VRENLDLARTLAQMFDSENGLQVFHQLIGSITDPVVQMYRITSLVPNIDIEKEQEVLSAATTLALMEKVHELLLHEKNVNEVRREIAETAKHDIDKQQREHLLRQQKRAIEQALGEEGGGSEETAELREQLAKANLPEAVQKEVIERVEQTLRTEFMSNLSQTRRRDAHEVMAEIFNNFDRQTETRFLTALEEENRDAAERIKALMFTFDDLIKLDTGSAQTLMRNIDKDKLAIALKISQRLYVMGHGRIVFEGTPQELRENSTIRKEWLEV